MSTSPRLPFLRLREAIVPRNRGGRDGASKDIEWLEGGEAADAEIGFRCPGCFHQFEVDAAYAGERGRCPKCEEIFRVPTQTEDAPVFGKPGVELSHRLVRIAHKQLRKDLADVIRSEKVAGHEAIRLLIAFEHGRSQFVYVHAGTEFEEERHNHIEMYSTIAREATAEQAAYAMRYMGERDFGGVVVVGKALALKHSMPLNRSTLGVFGQVVLEFAINADVLEHNLGGGDEL